MNSKKIYTCECGKVFNNPQSFNGHKGWCKVHLGDEKYYKNLNSQKLHSINGPKVSASIKKINVDNKKLNKQLHWEETAPHYCKKCGVELPKDLKLVFGSGVYCSRSCSNSRVQTDEMNNSRRLKLKKYTDDRFCKSCGVKISYKNKSGYCKTCYYKNVQRSEELKEKQRIKMKHKSRWNIHRNQTSYAEKFWMNVLENYSLNYFHEYQILKDNGHTYYLDFLIRKGDKLIDLEIDGSQHLYRVEHDNERDNYLTSKGYIVYRVKWNDIKSENGSKLMKIKIDDFIRFFSSI